jgi:hypothetical protein
MPHDLNTALEKRVAALQQVEAELASGV